MRQNVLSLFDSIADAANGVYEVAAFSEFFAETDNDHIDRTLGDGIISAPNRVDDLSTGKYPTGFLR